MKRRMRTGYSEHVRNFVVSKMVGGGQTVCCLCTHHTDLSETSEGCRGVEEIKDKGYVRDRSGQRPKERKGVIRSDSGG